MHLSDNMFGAVVLLSHWRAIAAPHSIFVLAFSHYHYFLFSFFRVFIRDAAPPPRQQGSKAWPSPKSNAIKLIIRGSVQHARPREKLLHALSLSVRCHAFNTNSTRFTHIC